jgi:ABC-type uncharacterized transport system substrate-binding protein
MKYLSLLAFLISSFVLQLHSFSQKQEILIIHSYHKGLEWTDDINKAIEDVFTPFNDVYDLDVEYLDSKKFDSTLFVDLATMYSKKYKDKNVAAIIISDNAALEFVLEFQDDFAPGAPVVFCGINNYSPSMLQGRTDITGIVEFVDYASNIELILSLHPETDTIIVVNDNKSLTSKLHKNLFVEATRQFVPKVNFVFWEDMSIEELEKEAAVKREKTVMFLINFHIDKNEIYIDYSELAKKTSKTNAIPVYGPFTFFLNKGIVGGMLTSGYFQGETASKMTMEILSGEKICDMPVVSTNTNKYMFDYEQLNVFNIDTNNLPADRVIINSEKFVHLSEVYDGRHIAVFFATNEYDDKDRWSTLQNPIKDAVAIAEVLHDRYGFDTIIVRNPELINLEKNLRVLSQATFGESDQLFIFFSGHGFFYEETKEGFIVAKDSEDDYTTTYFPFSRLADMLTKQPCKHIFLVLDVCYSGTFFNTIATKGELTADSKGAEIITGDYNTSLLNASEYRTRMVMTSSGKEMVSDGVAHSPFAAALLSILRSSNQKIITAYDLMQAVQNIPPYPKIGAFAGDEPGSNFFFILGE